MGSISHDRTPAGRQLLRCRQHVRQWLARERERATPEAIEAAELLVCNLDAAAYNGLAMERAHLLASLDKMASHRPKAAPSCRRG